MCVYMHICMCAPESAKMHSCLSPLHREVVGSSRQNAALTRYPGVTQLRRAAFLLGLHVAWFKGSEEYGKIVSALDLRDLHGRL